MSSAGIEQRLRQTYAAVGERTLIGAPAGTATVPLRAGEPRRTRPPGLVRAAVGVTVVAAAVLVAVVSDVTGPSGREPGPLVHALPGALPGAMLPGPSGGGTTPDLPLVRIESTAAGDTLEYAGDGQWLSITVERGPGAEQPVVEPDTEIEGRPARLDTVGTRRLTWKPNSEMLVTVRFDGGDVPTLIAIAEQLIYVDDVGWEAAIAHAGFGPRSPENRSGGVAEYELATEVPTIVRITGSLHTAFVIEFPNAGGAVSIPNIAQGCTASMSIAPGAASTHVTLLLDAPGRAVVRGADGTSATVDVQIPIPGTDHFIEVVDVGDHPDQPWTCEVQR